MGTTALSITLTDDNPLGPLSSFYSILVKVSEKPKPPEPPVPCEVTNTCPKPPDPDPDPPTKSDADKAIISDITNTGDIVVNLRSGFNLNDLADQFDNPDRRRALSVHNNYVQLPKTKKHRKLRLLQAVNAAIDTKDLITVELLPSPESKVDDL